jgi:AcrR family transcriptional regulator
MPLPRFVRLSQERRAAILDAALAEFAEHGYAAASFSRIVERLGASKGTIYYYFADKEDLYLTVLERALGRVGSQVTPPGPIDSAAAFWQATEGLYRAIIEVVRRDPLVVRMAQNSVADLERLTQSERMAPLLERMQAWTERMLDDGQRAGAVRADLPRGLLVRLVLAVGEVLDYHTLAGRELESEQAVDGVVARGLDLFRRMLEPAPVRTD